MLNQTPLIITCVLLRYLLPGGSAAHFKRDGYTFDVGSSMMFGFGEEGTTNLITKALAAVGKVIPTVPDATQVFYHLPKSAQFPKVCGLDETSLIVCVSIDLVSSAQSVGHKRLEMSVPHPLHSSYQRSCL